MLKSWVTTSLEQLILQGFDVYGFDQSAKEDQESIEKASQLRTRFLGDRLIHSIISSQSFH